MCHVPKGGSFHLNIWKKKYHEHLKDIQDEEEARLKRQQEQLLAYLEKKTSVHNRRKDMKQTQRLSNNMLRLYALVGLYLFMMMVRIVSTNLYNNYIPQIKREQLLLKQQHAVIKKKRDCNKKKMMTQQEE